MIFLGRVDKAQELLALPWTNINAQYANGITPLILAVQGTYLYLFITLNSYVLSFNISQMFCYTKLFSIVISQTLFLSGNSEILVQMLITHPNINVNLRGLDGYTALIKACGQEKVSYTKMILSHPYTNVNLATYYGETALTHAIRY